MNRATATIGSAVWFVIAPGLAAGVLPWWITGWRAQDGSMSWLPMRVLGIILMTVGIGVLAHAFARFVLEGRGTPAPVAAPQSMVVGGLYRYVRNPMYVAVLAVVVGQSLTLASLGLLWYTVVLAAVFAAFVYGYEQPKLRQRFGDDYLEYCRTVPAWIPHLRVRERPR